MRKLLLPLFAVAVCAVCAAPASASYYLTKGEARSATRHVMQDLGYSPTRAGVCHPKGLKRAATGYDYHKWVCLGIGWDGVDPTEDNWDCIVRMQITGHSGYYDYTYKSTGSTGNCAYGSW